jgi:hypothetical protein
MIGDRDASGGSARFQRADRGILPRSYFVVVRGVWQDAKRCTLEACTPKTSVI